MTLTAALPLLVTKEVRALATIWLTCLAALIGVALVGDGQFRALGYSLYVVGSAALGAMSIGHEYSHRTLGMLLSQPAHRARLLFIKMAVLAAMLVLLAVAAGMVLSTTRGFRAFALPSGSPTAFLWLPILMSLLLAPWLTMLCRNPIAGAVFTIAIPGTLFVAGDAAGYAIYGSTPEAIRVGLLFFWTGMLGFCAAGALLGPRMFLRLEAIEGRGPAFAPMALRGLRRGRPAFAPVVPRGLRRDTPAESGALRSRLRHPWWMLVKKELHLHQLPLVVSAIYVLFFLAIVSSRRLAPASLDTALSLLTFFYSFLLSILIGSIASAEERQSGTLEWQVMLPLSTATQFAIKVVTAVGVAIAVSLGLPALLVVLSPALTVDMVVGANDVLLRLLLPIVLCTLGSLYVSSLCSTGIQAMLFAVAVTPALALFAQSVLDPLNTSVFAWASRQAGAAPWLGVLPEDMRLPTWLALFLLAGFLLLLLRFALENHRSAERGAGRVWRQVLWLAASMTIGVICWSALAGAGAIR